MNEKLDKTFNIRCLPFEVAFWIIRRSYVWLEEQISCVLIWPVFRNLIPLFGIFLDEFDNFLERAMFTNELQSCIRTDFGDRIKIITAEKDAQIDELTMLVKSHHQYQQLYLCAIHVQTIQYLVEV